MIKLDHVSKSYGNDVIALDDVSVEVGKGEFVFVVGQSGSGKSTFLRLLTKEERPTAGRIWVAGKELNRLASWKVPALRRSIGCVFQDFKLLSNKTVRENVAFALEVIGARRHAIERTVPEVLKLVGLQDKTDRFPHELSGGEQQRVSIARAFVNRPLLMLCDEPTGNLDPTTSQDIMRLLERINRTGTTVVMATHDERIVDQMRKRVVELEHGKVVRDQERGCTTLAFRLSYIAVEAYRGFRRNLLLAISMVIIVAISLTLFGIALLAGKQVSLFGGYWSDKIEVSVFLAPKIPAEQRDTIRGQLESVPAVERVYYESKEDAYTRFRDQFKDSPDMVRNVSPDVLPESYRVKLKDPTQFAQVHDLFCSGRFNDRGKEICNPGIDSVIDQKKLVERLFAVLNMLKNSFFVLAAVLGIAAVVLIAVTVRVAAFARRKETQIMKLVGASNTYIRLPFLAEGVVAGLLGTLIAFGLLRAGMFYLDRVRNQVSIFQILPAVGMREFYASCVVLLALGVVASALASLLALRKYVRI